MLGIGFNFGPIPWYNEKFHTAAMSGARPRYVFKVGRTPWPKACGRSIYPIKPHYKTNMLPVLEMEL